ncbi:hypothetical protein [Streptomyces levis]|uniref:hypothetical protein n=1 Tax=Streptomyces levis TaxID=285566 RepID=UPI003C7A3104
MSFKNVFDAGGSEAGSARKAADDLNRDTPGADGVSGDVRELENERDPGVMRQTAHGAFAVMGFLGPLLQKFQDVSAAQRQVAEDPGATSGMAASAVKAAGPPKVDLRPEDLPKPEDLARMIGSRTSFARIATGLGASEGLAVDPARNTAYVADRAGRKLSAVKLDTGAHHVVASGLGDLGDVAVDGEGTAYTTDYAGARLLAVDLSSGTSRKVADVPGAYGVALDGVGTAYVANWADGHLVAVDLGSGGKRTVTEALPGGIAGVALDGQGKAYVGRREGGGDLFEVDLADGTHRLVTSLAGASTVRVVLDGTGWAYTCDHGGGRLYEITLADGAQRVVATGLGVCEGLALDGAGDRILVSNHAGDLWQISLRAARGLGGVGMVVVPPERRA